MPVQRSPPKTPGRDSDIEELCRTLDKSRKRHLSIGLLRGDQVQDRLRVQESSASPLLKKSKLKVPQASPPDPARRPPVPVPPAAPDMAMTMAQFKEYMEKNTNLRLESIDRTVAGLGAEVRSNTAKIEAQDTVVRENQRNIADLRSELEKVRAAPAPTGSGSEPGSIGPGWPSLPLRDPPSATPASTVRSLAEEEAFSCARRSLRLWPVPGALPNELWDSARTFITDKLMARLTQESIEAVSRVQIPSGPGVQMEALVVFRDVTTRDMVIGCAGKLSNSVDANGKPSAGMRIEVPQHLQQEFRVLFKYGQTLRARHGQGTRRHVKFDDVSRSLYLNVRLPGDESWSRVSAALALKGVRARQTMNDGELERRLDITGPLAPPQRPRATSLAEQSMTTDPWPTRRPGSTSSS